MPPAGADKPRRPYKNDLWLIEHHGRE